MTTAALLDVDGTLIDNNLLHVLAWRRTFQRFGIQVETNRILHGIGMGGDRMVPAILGEVDEEVAERLRGYNREEYVEKGLIRKGEPLPGAVRLLEALHARGVRIALASSAKREEIDHYLEMLGPSAKLVDAIVSKDQVETSKPAPDIFAAALDALGKPDEAVVVGDTVYDISAATQLGLPCIAVLTGGIERSLLEQAGAAEIFESVGAIADDLDRALALRAPVKRVA
jgi:membrane protein